MKKDKEFEEFVKNIVTNQIKKMFSKHSDIPDNQFDEDELNKGIDVEKEHTDSIEIAKSIAKDHLLEDPKYYSKLENIHKD